MEDSFVRELERKLHERPSHRGLDLRDLLVMGVEVAVTDEDVDGEILPRLEAQAGPLVTEVYGRFSEGFDTADLRDAQALLDSL